MPQKQKKDYQSILLEDMRDQIKLIAENLSGLHNKVDNFIVEMYSFRDKTEQNFAFVAKRLLLIENSLEEVKKELGKKADKNWVLERLDKMQKEIDLLRKLVTKRATANEAK